MALPDRQEVSASHGSEPSADLRIEKLTADIGMAIRSAAPGERSELKELAETLLREEFSSIAEENRTAAAPAGGRSNPLFAGILLTAFGLISFLLVPLVGAALGAIGIALVIWGAVLSGMRK